MIFETFLLILKKLFSIQIVQIVLQDSEISCFICENDWYTNYKLYIFFLNNYIT